jgi:hypothetical protein
MQKTIPGAENHRTSPFVWEERDGKPVKFIGGNDDFMDYLAKNKLEE